MIRRPLIRKLLLIPLLAASLSGCVAAAIPVLAGGVLVDKQTRGGGTAPAAVAEPPAAVTVPVEVAPVAQSAPTSIAPSSAELPPRDATMPVPIAPPSAVNPAPSADALEAFVHFVTARAAPPPLGQHRQSAFVDPATILAAPRWQDCGDHPVAVVIDLDPAQGTFNPDDPPSTARGLAEKLAEIRAAGVTVLWASANPVAAAQKVSIVLQATGLDPDRTDRLLLLRSASERKQTRRIAAARDWCVVAMAGDARGDFDEMFDYLRDPNGPVAVALAPNFGAGWFLIPNPID